MIDYIDNPPQQYVPPDTIRFNIGANRSLNQWKFRSIIVHELTHTSQDQKNKYPLVTRSVELFRQGINVKKSFKEEGCYDEYVQQGLQSELEAGNNQTSYLQWILDHEVIPEKERSSTERFLDQFKGWTSDIEYMLNDYKPTTSSQ